MIVFIKATFIVKKYRYICIRERGELAYNENADITFGIVSIDDKSFRISRGNAWQKIKIPRKKSWEI